MEPEEFVRGQDGGFVWWTRNGTFRNKRRNVVLEKEMLCMPLTLICFLRIFFSSHPPCYLWRELGGWPASPPQFPLQRVREAPWGVSQMWVAH